MSLRLFTGIFVPPHLHERLTLLQSGIPDARWVKPENFHITLSFIGGIDEGCTEDIHSALSRVRATRFDLTLGGAGKFGTKAARLIWAGVQPSAPLSHLQAKVHASLVQGGVELEARAYKPHVTLAYLKGGARDDQRPVNDWIAGSSAFLTPSFEVDHFALVRSTMGRGGSHYSVLEEYPLVKD